MHELSFDEIEELNLGATLLGTGGGGDPFIARLMAEQAVQDYGPIPIVRAQDLPQDGLVVTVAVIGAPTVIVEKVPAGTEFVGAVRSLASFLGKEIVAIMPVEVGGMNTMMPFAVAAELGLPIVDADGMRRAFPQIEMTVFTLQGIAASPMSLADEKGNFVVFDTTTNQVSERLARGNVIMLGMANAFSSYPMTAAQVTESAIHGSLTYALELGRRLKAIQGGVDGAYDDLLAFTGGQKLFSGKIIDLDRRTTDGFARGTVTIEHFDDPSRTLRIEIQNELLIALEDGRPVVTPPDLICMIDHETAQPITTEVLGYGQRVDVLALPCAPEWHQEGFLDVVGPRAFGYDIDYVAIGGETK
jgi:DUF917 family protein